MPTPRYHGGAALERIPLNVPGFMGLNTQAATSVLGPEWATTLTNTVVDDSGRLAARKGYIVRTTVAEPALFTSLGELQLRNGTREIYAGRDDGEIERSTDGGATWTSVTGTTTAANNGASIQWVNFDDKMIGITTANQLNIWSAGGAFANITDGPGSEPTGSVGMSAYGRLWITGSDNTTLQYSGLLTYNDWSSADSGVISFRNIWPSTGDKITAVAGFNGSIVVFGQRNIAIIADAAGSTRGINPATMYIADTISGVGCIARDSVQNVNGDLWFLSEVGVQSLGRLIQEKSNPLNNLSKNIQDSLSDMARVAASDEIKAIYSPNDRFYLLSLPNDDGESNESGAAVCFDTRSLLPDGSARVAGFWDGLVPLAAVVRDTNNEVLLSVRNGDANPGWVGYYTEYLDGTDTYAFNYTSGWLDLTGQGFLLLPKRLTGLFLTQNQQDIVFKWWFDFMDDVKSATYQLGAAGVTSLYGEATYGTTAADGEYGGSSALTEGRTAPGGNGEYIRLGCSTTINGGPLSLQQLEMFAKIGRFK